ncbi:MAG: ATP-binding protein [Clostridia bacterium]|nr:ATP-binding protein [Clostridia bacterium]
MTSIGEAKPDKPGMSIEECKNEIQKLGEEIKRIRDNPKIKDNRDFSEEEKKKLCKNYERCADLANRIAKLSKDNDESVKFREKAKLYDNRAQTYGSSRSAKHPTTTFDDVKGLDDVKKTVESFAFLAENRQIIDYYHLQGGLGMLMYGPPGTGKTMFAEAVANKLGLPLYIVTPADIFKPHVGESEESVRKIFDAMDAEEDGCVLFVDECESIFSARSSDTQDYKAAVTTELLQRINGFSDDSERKGTSRIMIAATNRPDMIDKAYLRYKRFSHQVCILPPDEKAIRAIIESKLKGIECEVSVDEIYEMTKKHTVASDPMGIKKEIVVKYYSAANICGVIEEACRFAIEEIQKAGSKQTIPLTREMFVKAFDKIMPGISAKDMEMYINFNQGNN